MLRTATSPRPPERQRASTFESGPGLTFAAWNREARTTSRLGTIPHGERANVLTHAIGATGFAIAGSLLFAHAVARGDVALTVSVAVFVATLLAMYCASALYHASSAVGRKSLLRAIDHSSIYLLIAGTYTPFAIDLGGFWGSLLLAIVWPVALIGVALKLTAPIRPRWLSTTIYIAMGWLVIIAAEPFLVHFPTATIVWLVAGGLAYTAGTPFYLRSHKPWMHAIWHGFVLLGSVFHFIAVATLTVGTHAAPAFAA